MIDAKMKKIMLKMARDAIMNVDNKKTIDELTNKRIIDMETGVFVSVYVDEELRGCIGNLDARDTQEGIVRNALYAAYGDSRFEPIQPEEYGAMKVHVNILSKPAPLSYNDADDLLKKIEGKGIIISRGYHQATFLPSVWEQVPDAKEFLQHLCVKAGLPSDDWKRPGLKVEWYSSEEFSE